MESVRPRHVWIVNPFDNLPTEGLRPQRYWLMARAFMADGWSVTYFTADFSHAFKRPRKLDATGASEPGIDVVLLHEPAYRANVGLARIWAHLCLARTWRRAAEARPAPDLVIVSSPPLSLVRAVRRYGGSHGVPYVVDIQDAWPETFERLVPRPLLAPLRICARRNYRAAAAVTAVARRYLDLARAYGVTAPLFACPHGTSARPGTVPFVPSADGCFRLAYVGNMSLSYDLRTVIAAVRTLPDVTLDLAGAGPDESALRAQAAGCDRIRFHGYLGPDGLQDFLARADAGVIPMFADSCVGLPGKLADYAVAGLPVINALPGETAELLARYGAGVSYAAGSSDSFRAAVAHVRALSRTAGSGLASEFDASKLYAAYVRFVS